MPFSTITVKSQLVMPKITTKKRKINRKSEKFIYKLHFLKSCYK